LEARRVLVLAPHTDDAELGCGGSIARFVEEQIEVFVAAFSTAEESLPPGSDPNLLRDEFKQATGVLGIPEDHTFVYKYPVRRLSYHRQDVLEELIRIRRDVVPSTVFLPSANDFHQDHQVLHVEGMRAFKDLTTWGYDLPWNHVTFSAQAFITLHKSHMQRKWEALSCYQSQRQLGRFYFSPEFIESLARVRGTQIGVEFAEAFEVMRVRW
jgi:LmbE family N-acetylglucosaminyl deacetylase